MAHMRTLASLEVHDAGSKREQRAARYVAGQMKKAGLSVTNGTFAFHSFTLEDAVPSSLTICRIQSSSES